jgi:hypothetical protein
VCCSDACRAGWFRGGLFEAVDFGANTIGAGVAEVGEVGQRLSPYVARGGGVPRIEVGVAQTIATNIG